MLISSLFFHASTGENLHDIFQTVRSAGTISFFYMQLCKKKLSAFLKTPEIGGGNKLNVMNVMSIYNASPKLS